MRHADLESQKDGKEIMGESAVFHWIDEPTDPDAMRRIMESQMAGISFKSVLQKAVSEYNDTVKSVGVGDIFSSSDVTKTTTYHYIADGNDLSVDLVIRTPRDGEFDEC